MANAHMYFVLGSKNTLFVPSGATRYTFPSGDVPIYRLFFESSAIAWAASSDDWNRVVDFPESSKRRTFAFGPPAAYSLPRESIRRAQIYARLGSANDSNFGAGSIVPSLRIATPCAVPLANCA